MWILRQLTHEVRQCLSSRSVFDYLNDVWNIIDVLLLGFYCTTATLFLIQELWWCKQAAAIAILLAYLKFTQFAQAFPELGRLVHMVFAVVSGMKDFMALLGLAIIGLGFAFMLVFSAGPFSRAVGASGPTGLSNIRP